MRRMPPPPHYHQMSRNKDPLTVAEAAYFINCCPATIIQQIKIGGLPARKVRGRYVIRNFDFWHWVNAPRREVFARFINAVCGP